jgi:hypothetical protein
LAKKTGQFEKLSEQNLIDCNKDEMEGNWGCEGVSFLKQKKKRNMSQSCPKIFRVFIVSSARKL